MNDGPVFKAIKVAGRIGDWQNPVLNRIMGRKTTRRTMGVANWIVTFFVIGTCAALLDKASQLSHEIGETVVTDTVTVRDTVLINNAMDLCPVCRYPLPWKVGTEAKDAKQCPNCGNYLLRISEYGTIFTLKAP